MNQEKLDEIIGKAEVLSEAMPYVERYRDKTVVIKYGGAAMIDPELKKAVIKDIALMSMVGIRVVIVHGGGKEITELLNQLGAETKFIDGQRVTDLQALDAAEMILAGRVSGAIVSGLNMNGTMAVGISGKGGSLLRAQKKEGNLGYVGEITKVRPKIVQTLVRDGFVPVISPIALGEDGQTYNINADVAATEIATNIGAHKLVFLSDIPGVLRNPEDPESLISSIKSGEIESLIDDQVISGGMIPKIRSAGKALEICEKVHILDGRRPHSLLLEIFTKEGIGTEIVR